MPATGWQVTFQVLAPATERLDRFLADQLDLSRTQAARLIGESAVRVDGDVARASRTLVRGETVTVNVPASAPPPRHLVARPMTLSVVFEDDVMLVIDKPAGLVVHPAPGHWDDTLVNALLARPSGVAGGRADRPGIVHRLDRDTSGLLVVAKTEDAHRRLARAIAARRVERTYAALVWGHLAAPLTIDAPIARHPKDRKRMAVADGGRHAETLVEPIARFALADLVRVRLKTGRTHQIRVHLAHVGHPIVGDPVYGGGGSRRVTGAARRAADRLAAAAPRQALHAAQLAFAHPDTRDWMTFRSEWPADLVDALTVASDDRELLARPNRLEYLRFFK